MKKIYFTVIALLLSLASFAISAITGPSVFCVGSSAGLADSTTGGTWTSSSTAIATVGATSGMVAGVAAGAATITYTVGTAFVVYPISVISGLPAIGGPSTVCTGATITLTDAVSGGAWTGTTAVASVDTNTGVVTGLTVGTVTIFYGVGAGCTSVSKTISVLPGGIISAITGPTTVCIGSSITLYDSTAGGTWSSSADASITSLGVLTGLIGGWDTVSYSTSSSCGTATVTYLVDINNTSAGTTIAGPDSMCIGSANVVFDSVAGGSWSSSNTAVITVDAFGNISAIAAGTVTVSYIYTTCGSSYTATKLITVAAAPPAITGGSVVPVGSGLSLHDAITGGLWTTSDSTIASINHTTGLVTGVTPGVVTITYTVDSGCIVTTTITVGLPSSVSNISQSIAQVSIYPNPAATSLTVQWSDQAPANATAIITDITGREVYKNEFAMIPSSGNRQLDLSALQPGIFFIAIRSAQTNYNSKLVIEK